MDFYVTSTDAFHYSLVISLFILVFLADAPGEAETGAFWFMPCIHVAVYLGGKNYILSRVLAFYPNKDRVSVKMIISENSHFMFPFEQGDIFLSFRLPNVSVNKKMHHHVSNFFFS